MAEPEIQPNEAYILVVPMDKNKAYERVRNLRNNPGRRLDHEEPHVYEEIELNQPENSNADPVYEENSGRPQMSSEVSEVPTSVMQQRTYYANLPFST